MMPSCRIALLAMLLVSCSTATATATAPDASQPEAEVYVELLWQKTPEGAIARQIAHSFALDGRFDHQVCVAILEEGIDVQGMTLQAVDQSGAVVAGRAHRDFDGRKKCVPADLPAAAVPGQWTFKVYLDGIDLAVGERMIDVFPTVDALVSRAPADVPYVLGRPNYDSSIPPGDFHGEVSWIMHVTRSGSVSRVEIETAEGVGAKMRDRALAAGFLTLFPPDPARAENAKFRRQVSFRNSE